MTRPIAVLGTLALLLGGATAADAALYRPESGNGELFFNVRDPVAQVSYSFDLGIRINDFFNDTQQNTGYQRFWVFDSATFLGFLAQVSDPAILEWSVLGYDNTGGSAAGNQRLFTTVAQGSETRIANLTNANFSLAVNSAASSQFFDAINVQGTHGVTGTAPDFEFDGEATVRLDAGGTTGNAYYGAPGRLTPNFNGVSPFAATNLVGRSSWFYYLTRSSSLNGANNRVLIDEFDNGNPTDGGRDGYWGFTLASDPATTLPEWQGKYLLSFTLPAFSTVLLNSTRQFAAGIGRTEYSGGFFTESVGGLAAASSLEGASAETITLLADAATWSATGPGLPVLLSPVPEPDTAALWAFGLLGLGAATWQRRARCVRHRHA